MMVLRTCRDCGLEARSMSDLDLFMSAQAMNYGRANLCKKCRNKRMKKRRDEDDDYYLTIKYDVMIQRCYNPNHIWYHRYGGRGIKICDKWLGNSMAFIKWAKGSGWKRELQIDRIDNDKGYEPSNCRWVKPVLNSRNREYHATDFENMTRVCRICGLEKPLTEFWGDRTMPLGKEYLCKSCRINERKKYGWNKK